MGIMPSDEEIRIAITALANTKDALKNIQALEKSIGLTTSSAERMKKATAGMVSPNAPKEVEALDKSLDKVDKTGQKVNKTFSSMINVVKGALTAMLTLAALRKVTEFFTSALDSAQQFRAQMVQLNFSEVILSKKGMDITRAELDKFIADIEERYQYLSKLDATKIVSETAGAVQEFDVSKSQLGELADAIAYIQLQNKLLGREEADAAHIINAAMDARSNFFNGMGINITETIVKEKAYKMGLVEVGAELSKQQRFQAILALLTEQTSGKQEELINQLRGTPLGEQLKFNKEWQDTLEKVGESLLLVKDEFIQLFNNINSNTGITDGVIQFFSTSATEMVKVIDYLGQINTSYQTLSDNISVVNVGGAKFSETLKEIGDRLFVFETVLSIFQGLGALLATAVTGLVTFFAVLGSGGGLKKALYDSGIEAGGAFIEGMSIAIETLLGDETGKVATFIKNTWKSAFGVDIDEMHTAKEVKNGVSNPIQDTPTGETMADGIDAESENVQKAVEKMREEVVDEYLKMQQEIEDATIDFNRKMDDISSEYQFKRIDAEQDYQSKIADINRDANRKLEDLANSHRQAEAKARQDAINKEKEYQNKLLELREEFLMDLDDALHARDARQILKLIKQYNLDKTQAQRQRELQKQEQAAEAKLRQEGYDAERKQAEAEKKRKLEDAAIAHQEKLAQLAEEEERERLEAQLAYQRKMQDLETDMQQRLALLGAGLVEEFNLTKAGLDAVLALYTAYYGPGGAVEQVYQAMLTRLASQTPPAPSSDNLPPGANPEDPQSQPGGYGNQNGQMFKFAEGGTLIANRPTKVLMAEGGTPEVATFTPLGKTGKDVNKLFSNMSGGGSGMGGKMLIEVLLSPDLEARVVKNSMEATANVVARVVRSK